MPPSDPIYKKIPEPKIPYFKIKFRRVQSTLNIYNEESEFGQGYRGKRGWQIIKDNMIFGMKDYISFREDTEFATVKSKAIKYLGCCYVPTDSGSFESYWLQNHRLFIDKTKGDSSQDDPKTFALYTKFPETLEQPFTASPVVEIPFVNYKNTEGGVSVKVSKVNFDSSCSYMNVVRFNGITDVLAIKQLNSSYGAWGCLISQKQLVSDPSVYMEIDVPGSPINRSDGNLVPSPFPGIDRKPATPKNANWSEGADQLMARFSDFLDGIAFGAGFCLTLGMNTPGELQIWVMKGGVGVIMAIHRGKVQFFPGVEVKDFIGSTVEFLAEWDYPGYYTITSNIFSKPIQVHFNREDRFAAMLSEQIVEGSSGYSHPSDASSLAEASETNRKFTPVKVDAGNCAVQMFNMGSFTFSFGLVRYPVNYAFYFDHGLIKKSNNPNPDANRCDYEVKVLHHESTEPSITPFIMTSKYKEHNNVYKLYGGAYVSKGNLYSRQGEGGGELEYISEHTLEDELRPLYFISFDAVVDQDEETTLFPGEEVGYRLMSFEIDAKINNFYKITYGGSITFNNYYGDFDNLPGVVGIEIRYAWLNSAQMAEIAATGSSSGIVSEDDMSVLFRGIMMNPKHSRESITQKTVTFDLVDAWYPLSVNKIINSPFYDGTRLIDALESLLKMAGYGKDRVELLPGAREEMERYVLPLPPQVYISPKYRFSFGTNYEEAIDTLLKLKRVFYYFDMSDSKLVLMGESDIFGEDKKIYTFYSNMEDIPADVQDEDVYSILTKYQYTVDSSSIINEVTVIGADWSEMAKVKDEFSTNVVKAKAKDERSINDPTADNYLGFKNPMFLSKVWIVTQNDANYYARDLLARASRPVTSVSWATPYYTFIPLYSRIQFKDHRGVIPQNEDFYLIGRSVSYDSKTLTMKGRYTATRLQEVMRGGLIQ